MESVNKFFKVQLKMTVFIYVNQQLKVVLKFGIQVKK